MWRTIEGFPNYQVHPTGMVRSLGARGKAGTVLKPQANTKRGGYLYVSLCKNNKTYRRVIHRIVAQAFIDNPSNLPEVNHKSGDKTDNRVVNLEWCTHKDNVTHAFKTGLTTSTNNKPILQYTKDGVFIKEYNTINNAAYELGIARQLISDVLRHKKKTTHGFVFVYKEVV